MTSLVQVNVYVTESIKKNMNRRKGELGVRFDSVYLNMLITRDLKKRNKF